MTSKEPPIGYWIKQVDELLTKGINEIHSSFELTRTEWQVLNSIKENEKISKSELSALIRPFESEDSLDTTLGKLREKKILSGETEKLLLTDKGIEMHKACMEKQKAFRQKAMTNISEQQYQEIIITLKKIAENLI